MSPDDIFAAQMWPWPDPALKRDSMGRVLFVNAAFLQMYGGTVDDWRGNAVTGWPAPQPPGLPYRFETRLASDDKEQVFDWMEFTLADGNAFAMARNVTYLFQTPDPDPGTQQQPDHFQADPVQSHQNTQAQIPPAPLGETHLPAFAQQEEAAPEIEAPFIAEQPIYEPMQAPVADTPNIEAYVAESHQAADAISADVASDPAFEAASYEELAVPQQTAVPEQAPLAIEPTLSYVPEEPPQERAYERRALPIENEDAVLGNNWRDAVIAKAVGAGVATTADASEADSDEASADNSDDSAGAIRILLAEDNAINALLTRTLLEADGHTVETVEDGALAVEAMKSSSYDLIFMDMRMPNMDGLEATRKIRAMSNVSKGLPIIALTANAFDDDRNACFDSGMNDFMTKPVSAEELSEMVRTWTKNKAQRDVAAA